MNIEIIVPPPVLPVTLPEMWAWLRLDPEGSPETHPDDPMLLSLIEAATDQCERATCRAFVEQTIRLTTGYWGIVGMELLRPPFRGLVSVNYRDLNDVQQSLPGANYIISTGGMVPKLQLASGYTWPQTYAREDAISVTYTVGYAPAGSPAEDYRANIPEAIKTAIKMGVQMLYDNLRPEELDRMKMAQKAILASHRVYNFVSM